MCLRRSQQSSASHLSNLKERVCKEKAHSPSTSQAKSHTTSTYPSAPTSPASNTVFFGHELQQSVVKTLRVQKKYRLYCRCSCWCQKGTPVGRGGGGSQMAHRDTKNTLFPNQIKNIYICNSKLNEADIVLSINRALYRRASRPRFIL